MKKLSNTGAEFKKSVAYKKNLHLLEDTLNTYFKYRNMLFYTMTLRRLFYLF